MPAPIEKHYRQKIFKFLNWWRKQAGESGYSHIPDQADPKLEARKKAPSWRRICKVLLKNDYHCYGLSFGADALPVRKAAGGRAAAINPEGSDAMIAKTVKQYFKDCKHLPFEKRVAIYNEMTDILRDNDGPETPGAGPSS